MTIDWRNRLHLRDRLAEATGPFIMGILNVTPDSFSDGGCFFNIDNAKRQVDRMVDDGAHIIDIGGESTRPGAQKISAVEELERVLGLIQWAKKNHNILISIDSYKAEVARTAVEEGGADIINDISALGFDQHMGEVVTALAVPVVLMHIRGTPENMQKNPFYDDVIGEIRQYFDQRIQSAMEQGIKKEKIIIDPGIGFGKRVEDNINLINRLASFKEWGCPILVGLSRKSFLGQISGEEIPEKREVETVTANTIALLNGASIIRVHRVDQAVKMVRILQAFIPDR